MTCECMNDLGYRDFGCSCGEAPEPQPIGKLSPATHQPPDEILRELVKATIAYPFAEVSVTMDTCDGYWALTARGERGRYWIDIVFPEAKRLMVPWQYDDCELCGHPATFTAPGHDAPRCDGCELEDQGPPLARGMVIYGADDWHTVERVEGGIVYCEHGTVFAENEAEHFPREQWHYAPTDDSCKVTGDYQPAADFDAAEHALGEYPYGGMIRRKRLGVTQYHFGAGWAESESAAVDLAWQNI